jgi:hypothetical protein
MIIQTKHKSQTQHHTKTARQEGIVHEKLKCNESAKTVSNSEVSGIQKYETAHYKAYSTQSHKQENSENASIGNNSNEMTVWVPVENDKQDIAVYQASSNKQTQHLNPSSQRLLSDTMIKNSNLESKSKSMTTTNNGAIGRSEWSTTSVQASKESVVNGQLEGKQNVCPYCKANGDVSQTVYGSQTDFINLSSENTQGRATNSIDDQRTAHAYINCGYENTEGVELKGIQSNGSVGCVEEKRGSHHMGYVNDESTSKSELQQTSVINNSWGNTSGDSFGFEVQEETLWLQNDSDDNQSEKSAVIMPSSSELDRFMVKKNVQPVKTREQVYEIKTVLLPGQTNQKESVTTRQLDSDDASMLFRQTGIKQDFKNPHTAGSSLTMHDQNFTRGGEKSHEIKPEWIPHQRDHNRENALKEHIILKENELRQIVSVPHSSERLEGSIDHNKQGEVNTELTKHQTSESVESTRKSLAYLEEGKQKPVLTRPHKLGGEQQNSSSVRQLDLESDMNYEVVQKQALTSTNVNKRSHAIDIKSTSLHKSEEFADRYIVHWIYLVQNFNYSREAHV